MKHRVFNFHDHEPRQQRKAHKCHEVEPRINEREAVEHRDLIEHVIMPQGEEPRHGLDGRIHTHHRKSETRQRETEHSPERADTHRHTE